MASHKIKIEGVADFSAISKDIASITKEVSKAFGDKGAKILDESSINFLKIAAPTLIGRVEDELKKLTNEAHELDKALKGSTKDSKKQEELSKKRLENVRKTVAAEKDLRNLKKAQNTVNAGGQVPEAPKTGTNKPNVGGDLPDNVVPLRKGKGKEKSFGDVASNQISHSVQQVAGEIPGVGPAMDVGGSALQAGKAASAAGLGGAAIAGLSVLAAAAAAAAVAISRMASGFEVFKQAIPNLLALTGMEVKPLSKDPRAVAGAKQLGFDKNEMLDLQKPLEQALGKAKSPEQDSNRMLNILTAARDTGMDPRQIISGADQLRQQGGTEVGSRQISAILDKAITSGMDKTQASSFLSSAVSLLSEINTNGISNSSQLLSVMGDLVAGGNMSSEQAGKTISGMSNAIAGSSGENNSFFQGAAANAGLGGGSILGTQFAVKQGLAGVNYGDMEKQVGDTSHGKMGIQAMKDMGLGDKDFTKKFSESILKEIDQRFDTKTKGGRQAALGFTGQMFGTKTAGESVKVLAVLEKMKAGTSLSKGDKKLLEDLGKDPDATWRENTLAKLDATALNTAATVAALNNGQFDLGETSAQYFNKLTDAMTSLDGSIKKMLDSETFSTIKKGLGEVADVISRVMGGVFDDLMKLPERLGGIFDKLMDDPLEFGKTMGKGFADVVMTVWDAMLKGIESVWKTIMDVVKNPQELFTNAGAVVDTVTDAFKGASDLIDGFLQGAAEAQVENEDTGKVSYTDGQNQQLDDMKGVVKGIYGATAPGVAVRAADETMQSVKSNGVNTPAPTPPAAAPQAHAPVTDISEMVHEQKKTNQLLERSTRPGGAPRSGRETSRP